MALSTSLTLLSSFQDQPESAMHPDAVAKLLIKGESDLFRAEITKALRMLTFSYRYHIGQSEVYHLLRNTPSRLYGCDHWVGTIAEEDSPICADVGTINAKTEVGRTWA